MQLTAIDSLVLRRSVNHPQFLYPFDDYHHFISNNHFDVIGILPAPTEDGDAVLMGAIGHQLVNLEMANEKGFDGFGVCNNHSLDLLEIFNVLYREDGDTCQYAPSILAAFDYAPSNLNFSYISNEEFLDKSWGPAALYLLSEHIVNVGFIVIGVSGLDAQNATESSRVALSRAEKLTSMGFVQCGETPFFIFCKNFSELCLRDEWQVTGYR